METMINLTDLLKHEIIDLYSVEEQIIDAMPAMIEKAKNPELKRALREHLKLTEEHKNRLDKLKQIFSEGEESDGSESGEKKGFFSRLFGGGGGEKCKGMEGILKEGKDMMNADVADETLDAVIIACAQKVEHYEICGYGTARAYARELKLAEVERLLTQTLNEEYTADDMLTQLAVGKSNLEAENATGDDSPGSLGRSARGGGSSKSGSSKGESSKGGSSKGSSKGGSSKSGSSKGGSSKGGSSKGAVSSNVRSSSKGGASSKVSSAKDGNSSRGSSSKGGSKGSSKGGNSRVR